MRKLRDKMLSILTSLDMFVSSSLLLSYALTGLKLLMTFYYVSNLILLVIVVIYFFDLSHKRSRIEDTWRHIRERKEEEE